MNKQSYPVVLLHGLNSHVVGLVPSILDHLGLISSPQSMGGKLTCGQIGGTMLFHLWHHRRQNSTPINSVVLWSSKDYKGIFKPLITSGCVLHFILSSLHFGFSETSFVLVLKWWNQHTESLIQSISFLWNTVTAFTSVYFYLHSVYIILYVSLTSLYNCLHNLQIKEKTFTHLHPLSFLFHSFLKIYLRERKQANITVWINCVNNRFCVSEVQH